MLKFLFQFSLSHLLPRQNTYSFRSSFCPRRSLEKGEMLLTWFGRVIFNFFAVALYHDKVTDLNSSLVLPHNLQGGQ